ncbi:hypothetical protein EDB85DRAFT_2047791 [Lactarius pseudohatsudake]|nr:hypothetical protein EDB85DRAFT_2047791 [Lactarius pseudohatsudake]
MAFPVLCRLPIICIWCSHMPCSRCSTDNSGPLSHAPSAVTLTIYCLQSPCAVQQEVCCHVQCITPVPGPSGCRLDNKE